MPYIGQDLQVAYQSYQIIDDISSSFNGVLTTFPLQVGGVTPVPFPINPQQCLISVNGVIQEPNPSGTSGFNLIGSNIVFSSAPTGGHAFFGVILAGADYVNVGVKYPSGSESAPSITFDTDLDTGIYNPGNNELGFSTNSIQRLKIDSSGRLLVGTFTSLDLNAPIQAASTTFGFQSFRFSTSAIGAGGAIDLARSNSDTVGTTAAIANGQGLGVARFRGAGNSSTYLTGAQIEAISDGGTVSATSMPTRLVFSTTEDGASSPTERFTIDSDGGLYGFGRQTLSSTTPGEKGGLVIVRQGSVNVSNQPSQVRFVGGSTGSITCVAFYTDTSLVGSIVRTLTTTSYNTSSDYRLKENVTPVTDGIARLQQLKPSCFNFIADPDTTVDGFLAHEVQTVVPEAITGEKDEVDDEGNPIYQGIDQSKLVPLLTAALQEAVAKIETLEDKVAALESA